MGKPQDSAKDGGSSDQLFYFLIALLAAGMFLKLLWPWIIRGWHFWLTHQQQIYLCTWALALAAFGLALASLRNKYIGRKSKKAVTEQDESSVFLGFDTGNHKAIHLKEEFRTAHTQVIGSTNAGKTASVILPWAVQDIEQGRGLLIIDGKADRGFLDKLYAHIVKSNRQNDFMVFSLASPSISSTYNPFCQGTPEQITERIFSTLNILDPYYRNVQFSALRAVIALLMQRGEKPMPGVIRELLRNKELLQGWMKGLEDKNLATDIEAIVKEKDDTFEKKYSGLVTALGHYSQGGTARLYNTRHPEIDLLDIIKQKKICYFQLPTMQFPELAAATGKLVLQSLQSAVSELQVASKPPSSLFSVYLDDFNDYIYPGFASLLNKSRSANVGVVFSHQSLGDLEKVGPEFKQIVVTNTNIKVVMRSNDPESAEHFAKIIGTKRTEKTTERRRSTFFGSQDTGDQSVRETEEYIYHPNTFKAELGRGEGVVVIPHPKGTVVRRVKFSPVSDLPVMSLPIRDLPLVDLVRESSYRGTSEQQIKTPNAMASPSTLDAVLGKNNNATGEITNEKRS